MKHIHNNKIPFTQFIPPYGQKRPIEIQMLPEVCEKADQIIEAGYRFTAENLSIGGLVSFCIEGYDPRIGEDNDCAGTLCANGPLVPEKIQEMIMNFDLNTFKGKPNANVN